MVKSNEISIFQGELMWQYNWPPQGIDVTQKFFLKFFEMVKMDLNMKQHDDSNKS